MASKKSDTGVTNAKEAPNEAAPMSANPDPSATDRPTLAPSPTTAEDPTRTPPVDRAVRRASFVGFPKTKFHPVYGPRTVNDPNEEAALEPAHNWFNSAEEADAHRTDREAQQVIHHNRSMKVYAALGAAQDGDKRPPEDVVRGEAGVVRNSVAATESLKAGNAEPL